MASNKKSYRCHVFVNFCQQRNGTDSFSWEKACGNPKDILQVPDMIVPDCLAYSQLFLDTGQLRLTVSWRNLKKNNQAHHISVISLQKMRLKGFLHRKLQQVNF